MQINAHFNPAARLRALIRRRARRKVGRRNACSVDTVSSRRGILVATTLWPVAKDEILPYAGLLWCSLRRPYQVSIHFDLWSLQLPCYCVWHSLVYTTGHFPTPSGEFQLYCTYRVSSNETTPLWDFGRSAISSWKVLVNIRAEMAP